MEGEQKEKEKSNKIFPDLLENINLQIQIFQKTSSKINIKKITVRYIVDIQLKTKSKILENERENTCYIIEKQ